MIRVVLFLSAACVSVPAQESTDIRGPANGWIEQTPVLTATADGERITAEGRVRQLPAIIEENLPVFAEPSEGKTILIRLTSPGAVALRIHFDEFHMPQGARAFVYGLSSDGSVTRIAGPYLGTGPLSSGEFWARPVPGETAIIELQMAGELASLPVTVREVAALDAIEDWVDAPAPQPTEVRTSMFRGARVTHAVVDGMAILEGDMLLGRVEELEPYIDGAEIRAGGKPLPERQSVAITGSQYRWPGGVIPYAIDTALPNQARVTDAIAHWNRKLAGSIQLVARTNEASYIIYKPASSATCSSYVGRIGGAQAINTGDYCSTGNMIHETGHAIGLFHEHTRMDRDNHVQILTQNIDPATAYNFQIMTDSVNPVPYDYSSIMHYPSYSFSINGRPTIVTIPAGIPIGQRSSLSDGDVGGVKAIYPSTTNGGSDGSSVRVTIASVPTARLVIIDDQTLATPVTQTWTVGSAHSVTALTAIYINGYKYAYTSWNDGGAQQHQATAPSTPLTLTANFSTQFLLTTKVNTPASGAVNRSLLSADGFYASGSSLDLTGIPAANRCLFGWSGILPVASPTVTVSMSQPQTVTANFQIGSVTVPPTINVKNNVVNLGVNVTATRGCIWKAVSQASWITVQNVTGQSSGVLNLKLGPNPSATVPRSGYVQVNNSLVRISQTGN